MGECLHLSVILSIKSYPTPLQDAKPVAPTKALCDLSELNQ